LQASSPHNTQTSSQISLAPAYQRTENEFVSAHRHSRLVAILKKTMPLAAIAIIVIFVGKVLLSLAPITNVSVEAASIQGGKLIMNKPELNGFNTESQAYHVRALKAVQDLSKPDMVFLEMLVADLPMASGTTANVISDEGIYDSKSETLILSHNVVIKAGHDINIQMQKAFVDMKASTMSSDMPVTVSTGSSVIKANSMRVQQNGDHITFTGQVKVTIMPKTSPTDLTPQQ